MSRAEGAIEAARAAGAETYAADEFAAATKALDRSRAAVDERDYRQALSHALDAFEQAELAAGTAATQKAKARGALDAALAELSTALGSLKAKIESAATARVPETRLKSPRTSLAALERTLQEARSAGDAGELAQASAALAGLSEKIAEFDRALDAQLESAKGGRRAR